MDAARENMEAIPTENNVGPLLYVVRSRDIVEMTGIPYYMKSLN
jgi:hypothetical protein